ncbi:class I SAM-dependent methyltransferase [Azospirillum doebereinerae]
MTQMELIGRLASSAATGRPEHLAGPSSWVEHIPFAFWLIDAIRPRSFVELGTASGISFCAVCQQVVNSEAPTACYAVGTWPEPADAEVHARLQAHHDPLYRGFSQILRTTANDALAYFPDASIDLLHIDAERGGAAARHDFEAWRPKLSARAVVLLHRTNRREDEDGVWPLWNELKLRYPGFAFVHGEGLGVLAVGGEIPDALRWLMDNLGSLTEEAGIIRGFFARQGADLLVRHENGELARALADARTQAGVQRETLERRTAEAAANQTEILRLVHEVTIRDTEIGRLNHEIIRRDTEIGRLTHEIALRDGEVGRLRSGIALRESEIDQKAGAQGVEIDRLGRELATRDDQIARQEQKLHQLSLELDRMHRHVAGMYSSTSWKFSRPVRAVKVIARRLARMARG